MDPDIALARSRKRERKKARRRQDREPNRQPRGECALCGEPVEEPKKPHVLQFCRRHSRADLPDEPVEMDEDMRPEPCGGCIEQAAEREAERRNDD